MTTNQNTSTEQAAHRHRVIERREQGFGGAIKQPDGTQNPSAHGCILLIETCRCGAERHTNINNQHSESSGWFHYADDEETPRPAWRNWISLRDTQAGA